MQIYIAAIYRCIIQFESSYEQHIFSEGREHLTTLAQNVASAMQL